MQHNERARCCRYAASTHILLETKLSPNVDAEILRTFLVVSTNEQALSRLLPDTTADLSLYRCCIALSRRPKRFEIVFRGMVQV